MASENENSNREDIYSKVVRAGKRTYFFDVKATRANDLYLTVTESKKRFHEDGKFSFEKHKIFLYKEDFDKFAEGFDDALDKIRELQDGNNEFQDAYTGENGQEDTMPEYTDVNFDDLDRD